MYPENEIFREGLDKLAEHYKEILTLLGEDPSREGLLKTPMRVAKAMQVLTRGYEMDAHQVLRDANQGVHRTDTPPAGSDGRRRGPSHVHADARCGEAEQRHHDQ